MFAFITPPSPAVALVLCSGLAPPGGIIGIPPGIIGIPPGIIGIPPGIIGIPPGIMPPGIAPGVGRPGIGVVPGMPITPGGVKIPVGCMFTMLIGMLLLYIMFIAAKLLPGGDVLYGATIGTASP
jgi:hypothetical protein